MLHFCVQHRIPNEVSKLKVMDVVTGRSIVQTNVGQENDRCLRIQITTIIKQRTEPTLKSMPIKIQVRMRGKIGLGKSRLPFYWKAELSDLQEIIIFSKAVKPISFLAALQLSSKHKVIKRRSLVVKKTPKTKKGCSRGSLIVNFASLGYENIIAPTIFDAGQCMGECTYPLGSMSNPTQHSLIQQLLHSLYGNRIAKSTCCAPRGFLPLTTMIDDKYSGGVAIRSLEDMIVSNCGCV